jgi:hypothetical protein
MLGRTYLLRGQPVTVVARWRHPVPGELPAPPRGVALDLAPTGGPPRNVLLQRADGSLLVRPFRGLRCRSEAPNG